MDILREVLEASPNAVLAIDTQGVIQQANRNVTAVLGYSPAEVEGMVVEDLLLEEDREHHVEYRERYLQDPEPRPMGQELDLYALTKDGEAVPVEISLGPIQKDGELHILATIADVSKRRERSRALERSNERLDQFASIVSHDLRNPLRVAEGNLELLQERYDDETLDAVARAHDRMRALIDDLLDLTRSEAAMSSEEVALADIARRSWDNVQTDEARLVIEADQPIQADPSRLQQLLENLFRNAVEHAGASPIVTVGQLENGFYVADDGPGIPEGEREAVFELGYTSQADGTGYGLNIVKEIADDHHWETELTQAESGGARFEFTGVTGD